MQSVGSWLSLVAPLIVAAVFRTLLVFLCPKRRKGPYPPGPKALPIIGNALDLQSLKDHPKDYVEWGKKYNSDILFASAFGTNILILNKQEDAEELLDRRAMLYADRPRIPIVPLLGWEAMISAMPYGRRWRLGRKVAHQNFNYTSSKQFWPIMRNTIQQFLEGLLENPAMFETHNKLLSASFAMASMYGYKVKSLNDPFFNLADESIAMATTLLTPDASIINFIPFLRLIPPWLSGPMTSRKVAAKVYKMTTSMQKLMWEWVEDRVHEGNAAPSLVSNFVENNMDSDVSEEEKQAVNDTAFTTYGGAVDTTIEFTANFFYLMATNPDAQKKAQAEIDKHVGPGRLPRLEDRPSLPYMEALYREVMRWKQSMPLVCPHALLEDDIYKGYFIPKGTTVIGNVWAMTHNEDVYPDPFAFKPERFFDENGQLNNNDRILNYGFGSRVCVGKAVASSLTWLMMTSSLTCFNIGKNKDEFGNEIEPNDGYNTTGFFAHKQPFKMAIVPRSSATKDLINLLKEG